MTSRTQNNNSNSSSNAPSTRSTQRRVYNRVSHHDEREEEEYNTAVIVNDDDVHPHQPSPESSQLPSAAPSNTTTTPRFSSRSLPVTLSSAISSRGRNFLARTTTTRRPAVAGAPTTTTLTAAVRSYHRVAASDDDVVVVDAASSEPPVATDRNPTVTSISSTSSLASQSVDDEENEEENSLAKGDPDEKATNLTVTILDYTQKKFNVPAHTKWTIAQFKVASSRVHKVPVGLQRLIFRGKLLTDEMTLQEAGIFESDLIVHLFPKPRVVINSNSSANTTNNNSACTASSGDQGDNDNDQGNNNDEEGARVPTIFMDANEAEQRAHILVLGSSEYIEAQNNVKLFSFMLLIISSIELLNLLAIALGVPQDEQGSGGGGGGSGAFAPGAGLDIDDIFPPQYNDDDWTNPNRNSSSYHNSHGGGGYPHNSTDIAASLMYQSWGWMNTVDLIISLAAVYVSITGIQASTENTLRLARVYLIGTFLVGVAWLLFNYFITVEINEAVEEDKRENHPNDDFVPDLSKNDIYAQALSVMVLPAMVWVMCCLRAAQFHHLLREAEEEAEARIQAELERSQNENGETNNAAAATTAATPGSGGSGANENDEEMALSTIASNPASRNNHLPAQPRRHRVTEPILT